MSSSRGVISGARRAAQIRRIVEDLMVRRGRGETIPDASVISSHPDLMPDLAKELSLLAMLERAKDSVSGTSQTGRRIESAIEPLSEDAFAGFRLAKELRRGGQGVVYEAVQTSTGRRVAIKMMREGHFAGDKDVSRFEREVRILGQLDHPGIVRITASGIRGGHFYYVMDFVEGVPLDQYAASVEHRASDVMRVMERVADAVNAAHLRGIIHRDLKPGNVLVDAAGQPRILDFGLARIVSETDGTMTMTGQFVGSLPWASPEQAAGDPSKIDLRTDVYSLGVMQYQALTGRFPYDVDSGPREALENIASAIPARPRSISSSIDVGAEAITLKCLNKEPERRYQSAGELASDIRRYLSGRPVLAHPPSLWYQARSVARRNRALVAGIVAVLAALVLGLIGTTWGMLRASAAQRGAVRERDEAQQNAYAASVAAADSALRVADSGEAKTRLRSAPDSLRGWEWRYLAARADDSRETVGLPLVWDSRATPDGESLLSIRRDGVLSLTDLTGKIRKWAVAFPESPGPNHQLVIGFSRSGRLAVTQNWDQALVWNMADGSLVRSLEMGGIWGFMSASFSPDESTLLVAGRNGLVKLWNLATGQAGPSRQMSDAFSVGADFSPDGTRIAASISWGVAILDAKTLETVREIRTAGIAHPDWGWVRYAPDGTRVFANRGPLIAAVDPEGEKATIEYRGFIQQLLPFAISPDGTRIAAGSWDRTLRVWNCADGSPLATLVGHEDRVLSASFTKQGLISAGADGVVKMWDERGKNWPVLLKSSARATVLPPGDRALAWSWERFEVVDLETEKWTRTASPPPGDPWSAAVSRDGRWVSTSDGDGGLSVWNLEDGSRLWRAMPSSGAVGASAFSPDGTLVASMHGGAAEFRDATNGTLKRSVPRADRINAPAAFHPRLPLFAAGDADGSLFLVNTTDWTARTVKYPEDYGRPGVLGLAFSEDGSRLATCDTGGGVVIWDTTSWRAVKRLTGMPPAAWSVAFSPDGTRLAVGSQDRMVHVFETGDWKRMIILRGHVGTVHSVSWTPDGRRLVSTGNDGTLRIWDAAPPTWDAGRPRAYEQPAANEFKKH